MEIPVRMKKFPLHQGKYPVHYTVHVSQDGKPDFRVIHTEHREKAIREKLCHMCGEPLEPTIVFIGGPKAEFYRAFIDGPMHEECAMYAAKACPYLANANYKPMTDAQVEEKMQGVEILKDVVPGRPERMGMFWTDGYRLAVTNQGLVFIANEFTRVDWSIMPERVQRAIALKGEA